MKIPIKEAIDSGVWFNCTARAHDISTEHEAFDEFGSVRFNFRVRLLSLNKIHLESIDQPKLLPKLDEGILWMLKLEVINLNKKPCYAWYVKDAIELFDQDNYLFKAYQNDDHLTYSSDFAKNNSLNRFTGWSDIPKLSPKLKTAGALAFILPDDDQAQYYLGVQDGEIQEV